jgi:hypothetical protein
LPTRTGRRSFSAPLVSPVLARYVGEFPLKALLLHSRHTLSTHRKSEGIRRLAVRAVARTLVPVVLLFAATTCKDMGPDRKPASVAIATTATTTLTAGSTVTLIATVENAGGQTLSGDWVEWLSNNPDVATVATGGVVAAHHAGTAMITASVGTIHSAPITVTVTPGAPTQLAVRIQPFGGASGVALTTQPTVEIRDSEENVVTTSTLTVTATIATGGGALMGSTATADAGVAVFTALTVTGTIGDRTLSFAVSGLTSITSVGFAVGPGVATRLFIRIAPQGATVGLPLVSQPAVEIRDDAGNIATTTATVVTASLATGGGTLTGATATAVNGIATFNSLSIIGVAGIRTLIFSAPGLSSATSDGFTLGVGPALALHLATAPGDAVSGVPFAKQPIVVVSDAGANIVATSAATVTATVAIGGGVLTNATATAANGIASFSGLTLNGTPGPHTLTFTSPGLTSVSTSSLNLVSGLATHLLVRVPPSGSSAGGALFIQPVVEGRDDDGNIAVNFNGTVTASASMGSLSGASVAAVAGVASFQSMGYNGPPGPVIVSFFSGSLPSVSAPPFIAQSGPPSQLVVTVSPPLTVANGVPMVPQPVVEIWDASGNRVTFPVTVTLTTDAVSGSITNASATTVNGVATFSGLSLSGIAGARDYIFKALGLGSNVYRITIK